MEAEFVSPADFRTGLLALGFDVTQEESDMLAGVLQTDENGNINLASLQQPGSPVMEQLAALQAWPAPEAAPEYDGEGEGEADFEASAPEILQTEAAFAALEALERGDEEGLAAALAAMPPADAEALQSALTGAPSADPPAAYESEPELADAQLPMHDAPARWSAASSTGGPSSSRRRVSYGSLRDTHPVEKPAGTSSPGTSRATSPPRSLTGSVSGILKRASPSVVAADRVSPQRQTSSLGGSEMGEGGAAFTAEDVASMPQLLTQWLMHNRVRVIDCFRAMDTNEDGLISPKEFAAGIADIGLAADAAEVGALFAQMDVDGSGFLDYQELHRLLRVGKAAETSKYLRSANAHARKHQVAPRRLDRSPPRLATTLSRRMSGVDSARRSGGVAEPEPVGVEEELWPASLRAMLLRERMRVIDLFRNWEGGGDGGVGGMIGVEDFKAGLHVLGLEASRRDIRQLFYAMGAEVALGGSAPPSQQQQLSSSPSGASSAMSTASKPTAKGGAGAGPAADEVTISFRELRRQLRVVAQRGTSHYLRAAAQQGVQLEAASEPGALLSGVGELREQQQLQRSDASGLAGAGSGNGDGDVNAAADELAKSLALLSPGGVAEGIAAGAGAAGAWLSSASVPSLAAMSKMGMGSSSDLSGDGVVRLGAAASSAKKRALAAAVEAASATETGQVTLQTAEMGVQQWARAHYSSLLGELRKWEVHAHGEIGFDTFADSLQSLGFPTTGQWAELQRVWASWQPNERGLLHWQRVRAMMTGGRLVKVQHKKHTTAMYFKQPSRAGEGFGNRSSPRFRADETTLLGPGKYNVGTADAMVGKQTYSASYVGHHSGKMLHTAPRFTPFKASATPGPGVYRPKHTLTESRHNL